MRFRLCCVLLGALILAACAGPAPEVPTLMPTNPPPATLVEPTQAAPPEQPTAEAPPVATAGDAGQVAATSTLQAMIVDTRPPPGTLVLDTSGGASGAQSFKSLTFTQTGGPQNLRHTIKLSSDGTLIVDGVLSMVSAEVVKQIDDLLVYIDFFDISGTFTGPSASPDTYQYSLKVESESQSQTIFTQDGLTPPQLLMAFTLINGLGITAQGANF